jgi:hypothetical protein
MRLSKQELYKCRRIYDRRHYRSSPLATRESVLSFINANARKSNTGVLHDIINRASMIARLPF